MILCLNQSGLTYGMLPAGFADGFGLASSIEFVNRNFPEQTQYFQIEGDLSTFGLKEKLLFPEEDPIAKFIFHNRKTGKVLEIKSLDEEQVQEISVCLEVLSKHTSNSNAVNSLPYPELIKGLTDIEVFVDYASPTDWNFSSRSSGIFRLHHASFLLQTEKARVLIDPHFVSNTNAELNSESLMMPHSFTSWISMQ